MHEKHIRMFDLKCSTFSEVSRLIDVVRYEDFVADPARLLAICDVRARASDPGVAVRRPPTAMVYETTAEDIACTRTFASSRRGRPSPALPLLSPLPQTTL